MIKLHRAAHVHTQISAYKLVKPEEALWVVGMSVPRFCAVGG